MAVSDFSPRKDIDAALKEYHQLRKAKNILDDPEIRNRLQKLVMFLEKEREALSEKQEPGARNVQMIYVAGIVHTLMMQQLFTNRDVDRWLQMDMEKGITEMLDQAISQFRDYLGE